MRKVLVAIGLAALLALGLTSVASAAAPQWRPFGNAEWQPHTGFDSQHGLVTMSDASGSYGGLELRNPVSDPDDLTALSFDFVPSVSGPSGGSPRLVVVFSDGGNATLRPLSWTAGTWQHEDGMTSSDWDNSGGSCGFLYETSWSQVKACHSGADVTEVFAVNDSGWLYPDGETAVLDNVTANSVAAGPGKSS